MPLEREELENVQSGQFEKLLAMLEHLSEPIIAIEPDGTIFFFSDGASVSLGVRSSDVIGRRLTSVMPLEPKDKIEKSFVHVIENKKRVSFEVTKGNSPYLYVLTPLLSKEKKLLGGLIEIKDQADKRKLQQMQVDFVSFVSHELRTPISTIKGYLDVLRQEATYLQPEHRTFLERAYISNDRQEKTVEKLLAMSKLERGTMDVNLESVQVDRFVADLVDEWRVEADKKNLNLVFVYPRFTISPASADPILLSGILENLLENAIKYTDSGKVSVSVGQKDNTIYLYVSDTGPGITPSVQDTLFEKFVRGEHSLTETTQGNGLGLYLSKSFAEIMGGDLRLQSKVGEGSTFVLTLQKYPDAR